MVVKKSGRQGAGKNKRIAREFPALYKNVAISFIVIAVILVAVVGYFSLVSATIKITPAKKEVKTEFTAEVLDTDAAVSEWQVKGKIIEETVDAEQKFVATGKKEISNTDVAGVMKVFNKSNKNQTLVATTRFLSPNKILLRAKNRIVVPAGGSTSVEVYADNPDDLNNNLLVDNNTHFIIPGLAEALQDKIYGENQGEIKATGEKREVLVVRQEDVDSAKEALKKQVADAETKKLSGANNFQNPGGVVNVEVVEFDLDKNVGEATDIFTAKAKLKVQAVLFDKYEVLEMAENKLLSVVPEEYDFIATDKDSLQAVVNATDLVNKKAELKISLAGYAVLKPSSEILNKNRFKGMSREMVKSYFIKFSSDVKGAEVDFFPFWVRHVPEMADRINVVIEK